jgi:hypothetical protein
MARIPFKISDFSQLISEVDQLRTDGSELVPAIERVSNKWGIEYDDLELRYYQEKKPNTSDLTQQRGNSALSSEQEESLVAIVMNITEHRGIAVAVSEIATLVERLFNVQVAESWAYRWVHRHSDRLRLGLSSEIRGIDRTQQNLLPKVQAFLDAWEMQQLQQPQLSSNTDSIMFYGQTRISLEPPTRLVVENIDEDNATAHMVHKRHLCTVLPFVAADGSVLMSVYIFQSRFVDETDVHSAASPLLMRCSRRSQWPRFYCFSNDGCLNAELLEACLAQMATLRAEQATASSDAPTFLFTSRLMADLNATAIAQLEHSHNMVHNIFPDHCAPWLTPLKTVAAPFTMLDKLIHDTESNVDLPTLLSRAEFRDALFTAIYDEEDHALAHDTIVFGFQQIGLFPYDRATVMSRTTENSLKPVESYDIDINELVAYIQEKRDLEIKRQAEIAEQMATHRRNLAIAEQAIMGKDVKRLEDAPHSDAAAAAATATTTTANIHVQTSLLLDPPLEESAADRKRKREDTDDAIEADRKRRKCRADCERVWQTGRDWNFCTTCDEFFVCPQHKASLPIHQCPKAPGNQSDKAFEPQSVLMATTALAD